MKKLLLSLSLVAAMACALVSCGGAGANHASKIELPDSAKVGVELPKVDGSISEYLSIVPMNYQLNLNDSVLSLNVDVETLKKYVGDGVSILTIKGKDEDTPAIYLTDSVGNAITTIKFIPDTAAVATIANAVQADKGTKTTITFVESVPLTVEQRDSLALIAKNFMLAANVTEEINSAAIDQAIAACNNAYKTGQYYWQGRAGWTTPKINQTRNAYLASLNRLRKLSGKMNDAQKAEYNKILRRKAADDAEFRRQMACEEGD